jgi:hypothetical protein
MDRDWFTVRLLQIDITVLVMIVLAGILAITSRLARDPSEHAVRWWLDRVQSTKSGIPRTVDPSVQQALATPPAPTEPATVGAVHTPERLDRLLEGSGRRQVLPAGSSQEQPDPGAGQKVA